MLRQSFPAWSEPARARSAQIPPEPIVESEAAAAATPGPPQLGSTSRWTSTSVSIPDPFRHSGCVFRTLEGVLRHVHHCLSRVVRFRRHLQAERQACVDGRLGQMPKQTVKDFGEDNAMRLAAAMACYIMLPAPADDRHHAKGAHGARHLPGRRRSWRGRSVSSSAPPAPRPSRQWWRTPTRAAGAAATIVSLAIVLFSASGVFVSLQDALNTIWEVKPKPDAGWWQWFRKRFLLMGMVLGIALLLMTSMVVTSVLHVIIDAIFGAERTGFLANAAAYATDFVVTVAVAWCCSWRCSRCCCT